MFYSKLYVSPKLKGKKRKMVHKIKQRKLVPNLYIIALSNGANLMEFYHSFTLCQPYYNEELPYIIGIADSYEEATKLVINILQDAFNKNGDYDIRKFCLNE